VPLDDIVHLEFQLQNKSINFYIYEKHSDHERITLKQALGKQVRKK
jgi:hypothetical protein